MRDMRNIYYSYIPGNIVPVIYIARDLRRAVNVTENSPSVCKSVIAECVINLPEYLIC